MPKAVVGSTVEHHELKSAPPDGFVDLKRMSYGQKMQRMQIGTQQVMRAIEPDGQNRKQRRARAEDIAAELDMKILTRVAAEFDFATCIVKHNLEDEAGKLLNFKANGTLDVLDPKIGDEISQLIEDMNNFDEEEAKDEPGNSKTGSEAS